MIQNKGVVVHPTAASFHTMLEKAREYAEESIKAAVEYNKKHWDKSHKEPDFAVGDEVLISTTNFTNFVGNRKLKDSFAGPFVIVKLHGPNAVEVALTGEIAHKHPTFPVSLIKRWHPSDSDRFPHRKQDNTVTPPLEVDTG